MDLLDKHIVTLFSLNVGNSQLFRFYVLQTLRSRPTRSTMMTVVGLLT